MGSTLFLHYPSSSWTFYPDLYAISFNIHQFNRLHKISYRQTFLLNARFSFSFSEPDQPCQYCNKEDEKEDPPEHMHSTKKSNLHYCSS